MSDIDPGLLRNISEIFGDMLDDPTITDIHCQPPRVRGGKCLIGYQKRGILTKVREIDPSQVQLFLMRLATYNNKIISEDRPRLNARLPTGERLHANFPRMTTGPSFSVRKPSTEVIDFDMLVSWGMLTKDQADKLRGFLFDGYTILVSGIPGAGKTTLTRALCNEDVIRNARTVFVQDPNEFIIDGEWVLHLECDEEGIPPIPISDGVKDALRENARNLVIGEVRTEGAAGNMVTALHTGCLVICTIHAGGARAALNRVADLTKADEGKRIELAELIGAVVHVTKTRKDERFVSEIVEVRGFKSGQFIVD